MFTRLLVVCLGLSLIHSTKLFAETHANGNSSMTANQGRSQSEAEYLRQVRYHLSMYQKMLQENDEELTKTQKEVMSKVNNAEWYMLGYVIRGAIDGYSFGLVLKGSMGAKALGAATMATTQATGTRSFAVNQWIQNGGLETIKGLAKSGGLIALSGGVNKATLPSYELQFAVPIWGSCVLANRFSKQVFNSDQILEELGNTQIELRREKFRVQNLIQETDKRISSLH